jgi:hypothetical protein
MPAAALELTPADPTAAAIERAFAGHVAERLNGRILRYSKRLDFLKSAERLRINRFRANLIIAMVQHQMPGRRPVSKSESLSQASSRFARIVPVLAGVVLAEAATFAGVWWLLHT